MFGYYDQPTLRSELTGFDSDREKGFDDLGIGHRVTRWLQRREFTPCRERKGHEELIRKVSVQGDLRSKISLHLVCDPGGDGFSGYPACSETAEHGAHVSRIYTDMHGIAGAWCDDGLDAAGSIGHTQLGTQNGDLPLADVLREPREENGGCLGCHCSAFRQLEGRIAMKGLNRGTKQASSSRVEAVTFQADARAESEPPEERQVRIFDEFKSRRAGIVGAALKEHLRTGRTEGEGRENRLQHEERAARRADVDLVTSRANRSRHEVQPSGCNRCAIDARSGDPGRRSDGRKVLRPQSRIVAPCADIVNCDCRSCEHGESERGADDLSAALAGRTVDLNHLAGTA